jgi:hypothetical protein
MQKSRGGIPEQKIKIPTLSQSTRPGWGTRNIKVKSGGQECPPYTLLPMCQLRLVRGLA